MTSWLSEVGALLQSRLDADILAGEVPEELEQVRAEFAQHEAVMTSLAQTCDVYRKEGKVEAAERFEQQTSVLKVSTETASKNPQILNLILYFSRDILRMFRLSSSCGNDRVISSQKCRVYVER